MAIRLITDMGLNIDTTSVTGSACLNAQDIQLRRQIYWTLYCSDKLWASYTGRVCTMLVSCVECKFNIIFQHLFVDSALASLYIINIMYQHRTAKDPFHYPMLPS